MCDGYYIGIFCESGGLKKNGWFMCHGSRWCWRENCVPHVFCHNVDRSTRSLCVVTFSLHLVSVSHRVNSLMQFHRLRPVFLSRICQTVQTIEQKIIALLILTCIIFFVFLLPSVLVSLFHFPPTSLATHVKDHSQICECPPHDASSCDRLGHGSKALTPHSYMDI